MHARSPPSPRGARCPRGRWPEGRQPRRRRFVLLRAQARAEAARLLAALMREAAARSCPGDTPGSNDESSAADLPLAPSRMASGEQTKMQVRPPERARDLRPTVSAYDFPSHRALRNVLGGGQDDDADARGLRRI
jgi:hypothetical protein